jgi:hypothetical protein
MQYVTDRGTGLYKVATGEDIAKAETPGMFDLKVGSDDTLADDMADSWG